MSFLNHTCIVTSEDAVIHEYCGYPRLGTDGGTPMDPYTIDVATLGSGALQFQYVLNSGLEGLIYYTDAAGRGWEAGTIRSCVYSAFPDGFLNGTFGAYCLATQLDLTTGTGDGYLLGIQSAFGGIHRVFLGRMGGGLVLDIADAGSMAVHTAAAQWPARQRFTFELRWLKKSGFASLEYWQGSNPDYSDLAQVLTFEHNDPPVADPIVEGLWALSGSTPLNVYFEQTVWHKGAR